MLKLKKIPIKKIEKGENSYPSIEDEMMAYPPSFSVNEKQIPEIKDWKTGETYTVVLEIKMKSMSSYDNGTKKRTDASFDVTSYGIPGDNEDMSDDDLEKLQGKALSN